MAGVSDENKAGGGQALGEESLESFFARTPRVALAFSGGCDSSYLLMAAAAAGCAVGAYCVKTAFQADFELEDATVTLRTASNWDSTLTINKGSNVDVAVGDCVVDAYGNLVGVISEVGLNYSVLSTVIDPSTEIGGRIPRTDDNAVLEGDFTLMREGRLKLSYLPENSQLISGDQITTSGLGDIYPSGLVVGTVESIHTEADGLTRYAVVTPAADLDDLRYVFVIKDFDVVS